MSSVAQVNYKCSKLIDTAEETSVGTNTVVTIIAGTIEFIIFCYIIYKLLYQQGIMKMHKALATCILGYHLSMVSYFAMICTAFIQAMFGVNNIYDFTSVSTCHIVNDIFFIPFWFAYSCSVLFWYFRLRIVFSGTIYRLSNKFHKYTTIWIVSQMCITIILIIAIYGWIFILSWDNNYKPTDLFCILKYNITDFFPYVITESESNYSYSELINNFYTCRSRTFSRDVSNNIYPYIWSLNSATILLGMVCVPVTNGILFYNYVKRMRMIVKNEIQSQKENAMTMASVSSSGSQSKNITSNINKSNINNDNVALNTIHIWQNVIIGVTSAISTLIALLSYAVFSTSVIASVIVYLDVILNGIFMLMILEIGEWLFCKCCKKFILNVLT